MKVLRPYTIKWKIHQLMVRAKESRMEVAIDEKALPRREGKRVSNSTLSAHIADLTKQFFPGYRFCYLTKGNLDQRYIMVMSEPDATEKQANRQPAAGQVANSVSMMPMKACVDAGYDNTSAVPPDYDEMMSKQRNGGQ